MSKRAKSVLKIPRNVLTDLIRSRQMFKAVILYLELKPLFYDGRFRNAKKQYKELAHYLGISLSAYRYKIKTLEKAGLIHFQTNGDLLLCSWETFFEFYGIERKDARKYKYFRLQNTVCVGFAIRQLIIEENFKTQEQAIEIKIFKSEILLAREMRLLNKFHNIQKDQSIPTGDKERTLKSLAIEMNSIKLRYRDTSKDPEFKKWKSSGKLAHLYVDAWKNYDKAIKEFNHTPNVNMQVSVSCYKTAKLYGLKSKASGHYWQKKMQERKQVLIKNKSVFVPNLSINQFQFEQSKGEVDFHYFRTKKGYFRRLNNLLYFTPLVTA